MPRIMRFIAFFSAAGTLGSAALFHHCGLDVFLTLAVTFGTTAYHFGVRLLVGFLFNVCMKNQADCQKKWYRLRPWENRLYQFLRVKAWKGKMPTYDPVVFSSKSRTWDEIAQAMCQSELTHETNIVLSFLPVIASKWFGSFEVFLITSICGGLFDLLFVIIQRYNRPRVMQIASRRRQRLVDQERISAGSGGRTAGSGHS